MSRGTVVKPVLASSYIENALIALCLAGSLILLGVAWQVGDASSQAQERQWQLVFVGLSLALAGQWIVGGSPQARKHQIAATCLVMGIAGFGIQRYFERLFAPDERIDRPDRGCLRAFQVRPFEVACFNIRDVAEPRARLRIGEVQPRVIRQAPEQRPDLLVAVRRHGIGELGEAIRCLPFERNSVSKKFLNGFHDGSFSQIGPTATAGT